MNETPRSWDMGDPEPEGVGTVWDHTHGGDREWGSGSWGRTYSGDWKGYPGGEKTYLGWAELVRRWGPVTEDIPVPKEAGR